MYHAILGFIGGVIVTAIVAFLRWTSQGFEEGFEKGLRHGYATRMVDEAKRSTLEAK